MADDEIDADPTALPDTSSAASGTEQQPDTADDIDPALADEILGADGQDNEDDDELDELEFGFKKYQVPKGLKTAVVALQGDYTKKTQGVAERQKALEAREAGIEERLKATDEELDSRAQLRGITKALADYSKLTPEDWAAHRRADPIGTDDHWTNFQLLKDQKAVLDEKIGKAEADRTQTAQRDLAKRVEETTAFAQKNIPGFKKEQIDTLIGFAGEMGIDEATIKKNWSPTFYKLLHRAHLGEQLIKKQAAARKAANPGTPAEPLKTLATRATSAGRKPLEKMSMAEHSALFKKEQESRAAGR